MESFQFGPHRLTLTATPDPSRVTVPAAELDALRATARELVALTDALVSVPGTHMHIRAVKGLARAVAGRLDGLDR